MCQRHEMASPHFGTEEIEILNKNYEGRRIGKNWPMA
jgi:hypothetical protein